MIKEELNTFDHFIKKCPKKIQFEFYAVNTLPDHPAHFWGRGEYYITELYLQFVQTKSNSYTIFIPIEVWVPDHMGNIEYSELKDFEESIEYITFTDDNGNETCIYKK